jgi:riboflavin transporter FmnP
VHLVAFIIRIYHDARSSECQIIHGYLVPTSQRMKSMSILNTDLLVLFRKVLGVCCENGMKYVNELCGKLRVFEYTRRWYI